MPKKSKKYVVRLTEVEREICRQIVGKFKGTSQKVRRAQVLLKSDADARIGPMPGLLTPSAAEVRRWKIFASGW